MGRSRRAAKREGMDRRTLFAYGAAAAAVAAARPALGADRRPAPDAPAKVEAFELDELTINDLQKKMVSGEETARSLTADQLAGLEAVPDELPTPAAGSTYMPRSAPRATAPTALVAVP